MLRPIDDSTSRSLVGAWGTEHWPQHEARITAAFNATLDRPDVHAFAEENVAESFDETFDT